MRENVSDQVAIVFSFTSDWLRGWRKFYRPITEYSKAKPIQSRITFDTQLKNALMLLAQNQLTFYSLYFLKTNPWAWSGRGWGWGAGKSDKLSVRFFLASCPPPSHAMPWYLRPVVSEFISSIARWKKNMMEITK